VEELGADFVPLHKINKQWYQTIKNKFDVDQSGDNMIPIPGTFQGGFTPKFKLI